MRIAFGIGISAFLIMGLGACSTTDDDGTALNQAEEVDQRALLLQTGQNVLLIVEEGSASQRKGSQGLGRFVHGYRAGSQFFGPTRIVEHTPESLTFRGPRTTCTIHEGGRLGCENGDAGRWEITDLPVPGE
ncbi:MAG: hypothetical protein JJ926_14550 [Roseitalea sp.]|jgi:hypothetical protein|uniref:hypothetical protein n=1 Tax=Oceaniradius stylonematis TaxID=2184161 RepID=UPI000D6B48E4|nr:hypothetical protein [Oceaniradius stylonematis]MBO6554397.1 hypothetical protein [Roseitalea sp.]MBO6953442.1 hypothetical protein [Rhizobiaceae bacterium]MBO6593789.1 hypothetical protein [Roseitalea sp.]MBO6601186.1 hypothetical protein [Roseitalea sp.]MBO6613094.1 hypothetical protein [Roseitalea sp.]